MKNKHTDESYHKQYHNEYHIEYHKNDTGSVRKPEESDKKKTLPELPSLPRGQGSMKWCKEDLIMYRKYFDAGSEKIQIAVYGKTPNEVMKLMRAKEIEFTQKYVKDEAKTLEVALEEWIATRAISLKPSSYDRIEVTFKNQICGYSIASIRFQQITDADIRRHLEILIKRDKRSWSTVKKCYDLLNGFFRQAVQKKRLRDSPMEFVEMPTKGQMETQTKEICYLTVDEIAVFTKEATRLISGDMPAYNWGKPTSQQKEYCVPAYRYGWLFVFDIYTGLRIGELCALRWSDIDLENKTVSVTKSVHDVKNREYDESDPERMRLKRIRRYKLQEGTTKTEATRLIPLNTKALQAITEYKRFCEFTGPNDYVAATKNGDCNNLHNMYERLNDILRRAGIEKDDGAHGVHMFRHTCASLLFSRGVQVEVIASILGNSPDVCRKTYVHFTQQQKAEIIRKIAEFEI